MGASTRCGICAGAMVLLHAGGGDPAGADALSPTNHRPGEHGPLYRCLECGTVQQPDLPSGAALRTL